MTATLVELLYGCGISPAPRAKVLAFFLGCKGMEVTSRQIEREVDLRQPEVSLAISAFLEKKWICETKPKDHAGQGRPNKYFVLAIPPEAIYKSIAASIESESKKKNELLAELRTAMIPVKSAVPVESSVKKEQQLNLM